MEVRELILCEGKERGLVESLERQGKPSHSEGCGARGDEGNLREIMQIGGRLEPHAPRAARLR